MTNVSNLIAYEKLLEQEIAQLKEVLASAPEGFLIARTADNGNYHYSHKVYLSDGKTKEHYLGKEPSPEAMNLAEKAWAKKRLPRIMEEKELISRLLRIRQEEDPALSYLMRHPGLRPLLESSAVLTDRQINKWKHEPYRKSQNYPDQLRYSTVVPTLKVRSKAEADIVACLERHHIPYRYEEVITLNGQDYAMDFTCLNLRSKTKWYWDHRGMLDKPGYIQKTLHCDSAYLQAGIIPWINLIVTTETREHPLDLQWVEILTRFYLV